MIFYSVAVVQSFITTGLMSYRIWQAEKRTAAYRAGGRSLRPILWILIESASLQLVAETVLFSLYAANYNCQYLMLEPVTPLVVCCLAFGHTCHCVLLRIKFVYRALRSLQLPFASPFVLRNPQEQALPQGEANNNLERLVPFPCGILPSALPKMLRADATITQGVVNPSLNLKNLVQSTYQVLSSRQWLSTH